MFGSFCRAELKHIESFILLFCKEVLQLIMNRNHKIRSLCLIDLHSLSFKVNIKNSRLYLMCPRCVVFTPHLLCVLNQPSQEVVLEPSLGMNLCGRTWG